MQSLVHFAPVFPMYVGVILVYAYPCLASLCIPHVCGGDPQHRFKGKTGR